jgi:hypothetical protein
MGTPFTEIYDRFLGKITDDMYLELTPQDTYRDLQSLLVDAIPGFEFPRKVLSYTSTKITTTPEAVGYAALGDFLSDPDIPYSGIVIEETESGDVIVDESAFDVDLTSEEINILAILMMNGWLQRQVTSIENTRMKYSGTDFKFTSQANHLSKLLSLLKECQRQSHHMQRLYKRRKTDENG